MGQPRVFHPEKAVARAVRQFWQNSYEGTSLSNLTKTMGITRPNLYARSETRKHCFAKRWT
jgi:Bacterial regulatory proteins, tetR family